MRISFFALLAGLILSINTADAQIASHPRSPYLVPNFLLVSAGVNHISGSHARGLQRVYCKSGRQVPNIGLCKENGGNK
jgi:hypothetical protein